jgi:hypothetical protein
MTDMSREFVYPVVTEVPRAGAAAPPATPRGVPGRSQRQLVEASLLRCPDRPETRPGPYELSVMS